MADRGFRLGILRTQSHIITITHHSITGLFHVAHQHLPAQRVYLDTVANSQLCKQHHS